MEDFEIRSPNDKQKIERSEVATSADKLEERKRRRFRRVLSPDELEAMDADVVNAEFMGDEPEEPGVKPSYDHKGREVQHQLDEMDLAYAAASEEADSEGDDPAPRQDDPAEDPTRDPTG